MCKWCAGSTLKHERLLKLIQYRSTVRHKERFRTGKSASSTTGRHQGMSKLETHRSFFKYDDIAARVEQMELVFACL